MLEAYDLALLRYSLQNFSPFSSAKSAWWCCWSVHSRTNRHRWPWWTWTSRVRASERYHTHLPRLESVECNIYFLGSGVISRYMSLISHFLNYSRNLSSIPLYFTVTFLSATLSSHFSYNLSYSHTLFHSHRVICVSLQTHTSLPHSLII